jgi:hypothetical protein
MALPPMRAMSFRGICNVLRPRNNQTGQTFGIKTLPANTISLARSRLSEAASGISCAGLMGSAYESLARVERAFRSFKTIDSSDLSLCEPACVRPCVRTATSSIAEPPQHRQAAVSDRNKSVPDRAAPAILSR